MTSFLDAEHQARYFVYIAFILTPTLQVRYYGHPLKIRKWLP